MRILYLIYTKRLSINFLNGCGKTINKRVCSFGVVEAVYFSKNQVKEPKACFAAEIES